MPTFNDLKNKHQGETAIICGGGVSLPADLRQVKEADRLIGVNQHSLILPLDYLVFLDRQVWPLVEPYRDVKLLTKLKHYYSERNVYQISDAPTIGYSGFLAIWAADQMGFDRIEVCGVDSYSKRDDAREYWWQGPQTTLSNRHNLCKSDLELLKKFIDDLQCPERVYFASGRLKELHQ